MSFLHEFKTFALRGNVIDLAVGVVIGTAFGKIVTALVDQVIMPLIGLLVAGVSVKDLKLTLATADAAFHGSPAVILGYGAFLQTLVDFTIIAFVIFMVIRIMNRIILQRLIPDAPSTPATETLPPPPTETELLTQIRDLLAAQTAAPPTAPKR
jgi:large conductance mechanosensitive channel